MKKTGAVIVAAGLSSRMNDFKPLLPFESTTIARHNVRMLKSLELDPIVVVIGFKGDELKNHLSEEGVLFAENSEYKSTQMFDSVKIGIKSISDKCDRILIMPMDIPSIKRETYLDLLSKDAPIMRTKFGARCGHPIILDRSVVESFLNYNGENGLKGAILNCGIKPCDVSVQDEGILKDVDTPEDYKNLLDWMKK